MVYSNINDEWWDLKQIKNPAFILNLLINKENLLKTNAKYKSKKFEKSNIFCTEFLHNVLENGVLSEKFIALLLLSHPKLPKAIITGIAIH